MTVSEKPKASPPGKAEGASAPEVKISPEELLTKAKKPAADAMRLHPFYRGKVQTALRARVESLDDFAIWYTPGVAARMFAGSSLAPKVAVRNA